MFRVLKPGGRAAVAVWGKRERCGWSEIFPIVDARVNSDVCPLFFQLGGEGALRFAFQKAGFTELHEERLDRPLEFESGEKMLSAIFAGGPVALAYSKFSPQVKDEVHGEYLKSTEPYRRAGGFDIPGEFVFMLGKNP